MIEKVKTYIRQNRMIDPGDKVLVALSGGMDSVCLTDILLRLSDEFSFRLCAAHVEHGIRGEESRADLAFVREFCAARNLPLYVRELDVPALAAERRQGLELTAREERKAFFDSLCVGVGVTRIATAHQADDNAESVLLNLARGAALRGLCGIRPVNGRYIRPLLCVERREIEDYCRERGLAWRTDSTNADTDYARNFIRYEVVPRLRELNPRFTSVVSANTSALRAEDEYLDRVAEEAFRSFATVEKNKISLTLDQIPDEAVFSRVCLKMAEALGVTQDLYTPGFEAVRKLVAAGRTGKVAELPHGLRARLSYGKLIFSLAEEATEKPAAVRISKCGIYTFNGGKLRIRRLSAVPSDARGVGAVRYADADKLFGNELYLRAREDGDIIKPCGGGTKKLKKYLIDRRVDRIQRDRLPLLAAGSDVLWIAGLDISEHIRIDENTVRAVKITYEEEV